jgi:putative NADPH-quinone reductase
MGQPCRVLVLFAHPALHTSRVNRRLIDAIDGLDGVTINDLYAHYPNFHIDVAREQALLRQHDLIVFQHPFYWYSSPAILKQWQDLVLEHGFAYGQGGTALQGKAFLSVISTGGPAEAYGAHGSNHFSMLSCCRPCGTVRSIANACGSCRFFSATWRLCSPPPRVPAMHADDLFVQAFVYLAAAVLVVPISNRLGLGGLQVLATAVVIALLALLLGQTPPVALAVGLILAMSSTAIVLQTLTEKGLIKTDAGQSSFSVLLFQDIAVIPILAFLPLLASPGPGPLAADLLTPPAHAAGAAAPAAADPLLQALQVLGVVLAIIVGGRLRSAPASTSPCC